MSQTCEINQVIAYVSKILSNSIFLIKHTIS